MNRPDGRSHESVWLPLLMALTEVAPGWVVWKNADAALDGDGDIDSAAPADEWPQIEREFLAWAEDQGVGPAIVCRHIPGGLNLIALDGGTPFLEVGIKDRRIYRGSTLFRAAELAPMSEIDPRGFRRLRVGAEGTLKLALNGLRPGGRPDWASMGAKQVPEQVAADPDGVVAAASLFGLARASMVRGAGRVADRGWDRRAMLWVESWCVVRGLMEPGVALGRARFRLTRDQVCPVVNAMNHGRTVLGDRRAWIEQVARDHLVHGGLGPTS